MVNNEERKIKAVLFDMDGLMFDTERLYMDAWKKTGEKLGIPIGDEFLLQSRGMVRADSSKLFTKLYAPSMDYEEIIAVRQELFNKELEKGIVCKKGLKELLVYLKEHGYKTALATSTPKERALKLVRETGTEYFLDEFAFGDSVEKGKPEPDIFLKAAELVNVSPEFCLVLEDSKNGLIAGKRAGCKVIMIPDLVPETEELKTVIDAKLDDLEQVIGWLQKVNGEIE